MGVTRENGASPSEVRAVLDYAKKVVDLYPVAGRLDVFAIQQSEEDAAEWVLRWSSKEKFERRKTQFGAEAVPPKDAMEKYGIPKREVSADGTYVMRGDCILIRYSRPAHEARMAFPVVQAWQGVNKDMDAFLRDNPDALDPQQAEASRRGQRRPNRRPENNNLVNVLEAQGRSRAEIGV